MACTGPGRDGISETGREPDRLEQEADGDVFGLLGLAPEYVGTLLLICGLAFDEPFPVSSLPVRDAVQHQPEAFAMPLNTSAGVIDGSGELFGASLL